MSAHETTTRVGTDADAGPGERLREAREAAGLTLGEIASRLRLEPRVVERLESDDYEALHGPTFVRGYLGSYARVLDLPPQPILEAYERHGYGPPALVSELGAKSEVHVSDFPVRMVTYVIAGLLVVLVVLWWQSRQLEQTTPVQAGADTPEATSTAPGTDAPGEAMPASAAATPAPTDTPAEDTTRASAPPVTDYEPPAPADSTPEPGATTATPAVEPAAPLAAAPDLASATMPESEDAARGASDASAPERPQAPATPGSESEDAARGALDAAEASDTLDASPAGTGADAGEASADEARVASTEAPTAAPRPEPLPGSDVLAIQLARESWIEIYDRGGGRLFYSLAEQGSEVVVTGAGPMRVLLGEADGAAVAYNGEPFDLSRYQGRSVVRFTVGEASEPPTPQAAPGGAAEEPLTGKSVSPESGEDTQAIADARRSLDSEAATPPARTTAVAGSDPQAETDAALERTGDDTDAEPALRATRPDS